MYNAIFADNVLTIIDEIKSTFCKMGVDLENAQLLAEGIFLLNNNFITADALYEDFISYNESIDYGTFYSEIEKLRYRYSQDEYDAYRAAYVGLCVTILNEEIEKEIVYPKNTWGYDIFTFIKENTINKIIAQIYWNECWYWNESSWNFQYVDEQKVLGMIKEWGPNNCKIPTSEAILLTDSLWNF